jgi:hypothetical protein
MSYAADDTQAIAQRLKEIEAEKQVALTGTSAPVAQEQKDETPSGYGDYLAGAYGYPCGFTPFVSFWVDGKLTTVHGNHVWS